MGSVAPPGPIGAFTRLIRNRGHLRALTWRTIDDRYNAHYVDFDLYGTVNFTNNVGVKGGYRSRDVGYLIKTDSGSLTLKGIYFGAVVRY